MNARMIAEAPMGRDGTVEEMANVAVLLSSQQAGYITGSAIKITFPAIKAKPALVR